MIVIARTTKTYSHCLLEYSTARQESIPLQPQRMKPISEAILSALHCANTHTRGFSPSHTATVASFPFTSPCHSLDFTVR